MTSHTLSLRSTEVLEKLRSETNARAVILVNVDGEPLAEVGDVEAFPPALRAGLNAPAVRAAGGGLQLMDRLPLDTTSTGFHVSVVANAALLAVAFDARSSPELVSLLIPVARRPLEAVFAEQSASST